MCVSFLVFSCVLSCMLNCVTCDTGPPAVVRPVEIFSATVLSRAGASDMAWAPEDVVAVRNHPPFCAVFKNKRSIYQDRLGTTCLLGKVENRGVFLQGFKVQMATNFGPNLLTDTGGGQKTRPFAPLYTKNAIVLPRQARDKHTCRESTPKERRVFSYRRD